MKTEGEQVGGGKDKEGLSLEERNETLYFLTIIYQLPANYISLYQIVIPQYNKLMKN